jgi:hypothetical protein
MASKLEDLKQDLLSVGVNTEQMTVLILGGNEMVMGQLLNPITDNRFNWERIPDVAIMKSPKRLTRLSMVDRATGQLMSELRMSDFDFVSDGEVHFKHFGGFNVSWVDEEAQLQYLGSYKGFLESKKLASAQEAGIIIPGVVPNPIRK